MKGFLTVTSYDINNIKVIHQLLHDRLGSGEYNGDVLGNRILCYGPGRASFFASSHRSIPLSVGVSSLMSISILPVTSSVVLCL